MTDNPDYHLYADAALKWASGLSCRHKTCRPTNLCGPCNARTALEIRREEMQKCRTCGAEIKWVVTEQGKRMPLDVSTKTIFVPKIDPGAPEGAETVYVAKVGRESHFATCPQASQHRRQR